MSNMFSKSALLRPDYHPEQVGRYFETAHEIYDTGELDEMDSGGVRTVAFDAVLRNCRPQVVDIVLGRLEAALLQCRRMAFVAGNGHQTWMNQVIQLATTLYPRLLRPAGGRFAPTSGQGHGKADVDALMNRIAGRFNSDTTLTSSEVRGAVFRRARGDKTYGEPDVGRYLTRVIGIFPSVE